LDVPEKGMGNVGVCVLSYGLILLLLTAPSGEKGFPVQYFYTLAQGCLTRSKGIMRTIYDGSCFCISPLFKYSLFTVNLVSIIFTIKCKFYIKHGIYSISSLGKFPLRMVNLLSTFLYHGIT